MAERAPWETQAAEVAPWEAPAAPKKAAVESPPWQGDEAPPWSEVVRSLPAQFGVGLESVTAHLRLLKARENFAQRQNLSQPGFGTTEGGAVTGLVRPRTALRQDENAEIARIQTQTYEKEAEEAASLRSVVTPVNMSFGQQVASSIAQSAAPTLAGLAIGIVTRNPYLAMATAGAGGAALQGGSTYEEALEKGASHQQAARAAGIDAILEGIGEALPLGYALKEGIPLAKRIFGTIAAEAGQEAATQVMQDLHAFLSYNPDITFQEAWHNIKVAAVSGAIMGGVVGGAAHAADASRRSQLLDALGKPIDTERLKNTVRTDESYRNLSDRPEDIPAPTQTPSAEASTLLASIDAELDPTTLTDQDVEKARAIVHDFDKQRTETLPVPETIAKLRGLNELNPRGDLGELGESAKVARNARNYANENDLFARSERPVLYAPEGQDVAGLMLQQIPLTPGVYTVGVPTEDRNAETLKAYHDTLTQWAAEFMPNVTLLIMNESLPTDSAVGWHSRLESGVHVITPAVIRRMKSRWTFNTNALAKIFYNLAHEFGHALIDERFFEGVEPATVFMIRSQAQQGLIDKALIAQIPDARRRAVLREFNRIKAAVMSGEMTAGEFQLTWMNPAKAHKLSLTSEHHTPENAPALQLVDSILNRAYRNTQTLDSLALHKLRNEFLGLDEFFAEQTSRYAYARSWDEKAPASLQNLIGHALQSVRAALESFFKSLKKNGVLKPGVKFQEWLDSLSKDPLHALPVEKIVKPKKKKSTTAKKSAASKGVGFKEASDSRKGKPAKEKSAKEKPVEQLDHNVATASEKRQRIARAAVAQLAKEEVIGRDSAEYKELMSLIKAADWSTFNDMIQPYLEKKVQFEIEGDVPPFNRIGYERTGLTDQISGHAAFAQPTEEEARNPSVLADAIREWREKGFASKYFTAWFGDWQQNAVKASKVVNANGEPLTVFHATYKDFDTFRQGDIGFHFGTLRAAQNRAYGMPASTTEEEGRKLIATEAVAPDNWDRATEISFLPISLNIRNPLYIGEELVTMWDSVPDMLQFLKARGFITSEEAAQASANFYDPRLGENKYDRFEAVRQLLEAKGYDGIKYENTIEGDTSWVAFRPEQVKSVVGSSTFSKSPKIHFELDFDESKSDGYSAGRFYKKFKPLLPNPGPLRRALRHVVNLQYKTLQLQQLAHLNPEEGDLQFMVETNNAYERFKGALQAQANDAVARWHDLGKENFARVNKFLQAEFDSNTLWVDLVKENNGWIYRSSETFRQKLQEHGIDTTSGQGQDMARLILDIKNSLLEHVNQTERVLSYLMARRYANRPDVLRAALIPTARDIHEIRSRPFLPQGRFGNHVLTIEKKRDRGPGYEVVYRQAFETREERQAARERIEKRLKPDERVRSHDLTDTEYVLMSLPQDFLESVITELGLTEEQRNHLFDVLVPAKKEKLLKSYDRERLKLPGASEDILRSYSNFIWHNANLLAKTRYRADFNLAIQGMKSALRKAEYSGDEQQIDRLGQMHRYMERTRDAVMSPPNEAYLLRSIVALTYLMYNVKTALLNFYGLVTTWSDLTTRLGQVRGDALLTKATAAAFRSINPFDLNARRKGDYLPAEWQTALDRAIQEGQLTQSYAYHLAGMANSSNLHRLPGRDFLGKRGRDFIDLGMWVFRLTELSTRRVTFLAQYEAARKEEGSTPETAYQQAVAATNKLQNDYSQGNVAPFLRSGPGFRQLVPLATVFMSFTQHMSFHAFGGYEVGMRRTDKLQGRSPRKLYQSYTLKIILLTLLLAGYEGLPGAENILDLVDAIWKKWFGKPARQEVREGLRDLVRSTLDIETDPSALAHGLGHDVAGFNVSRSLGLGRIVPGTDVVGKSTSGDFKNDVGALALNILGPTGGLIEWLLKTGFGKGGFEEGMKRAPGAIGNVWNAYTWAHEGVRSPSGALITRDLKTGELRDLTTVEIYGKALGFNPTIIAQNREILFSQHDARMYWLGRRDRLLDDIWKATVQQDREAMADVMKNIEEFNNEIPEDYRGSLRLTLKQIADSRKARMRNMRLEERGLPPQKRFRELYRDVRDSFDPAAEQEP